jgi:hypothetical protein
MAGVALLAAPRWSRLAGRRRAALAVAAAAVAVAAGVALYAYRPASAKGRLLVWRVSAGMVAERPLAGHGAGAFAQKYMLYQARYFAQHPASPLALVADNVAYPFNEILGVAVALGLVGAALFAALLALALRAAQGLLRAALAALLAFAMFSYPSDVLPLLLLLPLLLGAAKAKAVFRVSLPRSATALAAVLMLAVAGLGGWMAAHIRPLSDALIMLSHHPQHRASIGLVEHAASSSMLRNAAFNDGYMVLFQSSMRDDAMRNKPPSSSLHIFPSSHLERLLPSCEAYCLLGCRYAARGEGSRADSMFRLASQMIPTRVRPRYYLWERSVAAGDTALATALARQILAAPTKAESLYTLRVKGRMKEYLRVEGD